MVQDPGYVPGLTRPVSVSEYATLTGVREAGVYAAIQALKIRSAYSNGQWYIEAPPNCEARLARLRRDKAGTRKEGGLADWVRGLADEHRQSDLQPQRESRLSEPPRRDPISQPKPVRAPVPQPVSNKQEDIGRASIMVPDHLYVRGLEEPLSASEYAKLEGLDEKDVLEAIHGLRGVYSLGWYLEAPPYSEERFSRLRAESKLEPRLLNWLQRRADLHANPQYKSEVERQRVHFIKSDPRFDRLSSADQSALINTREYAERPQPIDYGLSKYDILLHGSRYLLLNADLKYREEPSHEWRWIFFVAFIIYAGGCGSMLYLHDSGQLKGTSSQIVQLALVLAPVSLIGSMMLLSMTEGLVNAYRRRPSNPGYLRFKEAVWLHELYQSAVKAAAREAEQAILRKKRSYWEFLDGYAFERATAEILKRHQFNPIVTPGSADGGIDIEVTRNGLKGVVQCKAHVASVGPHVVRDLYGVINHCRASFGIIVSRGGFTRGAAEFARDKPILFLDTDDLIAMQEGRDVLAKAFTKNQPS
jgi:hypothetical protein